MGYYNRSIVVLIPAGKLNAANNYLERNGYGPNNFGTIEIIRKSDPVTADPIGYGTEFPADRALYRTIKKAIGQIALAEWFVGTRAKKHAKDFLDNHSPPLRVKPKPVGP